jgi:hypothetical protein
MQQQLPQVRVYYSSLNSQSTKSAYSYMAHILERNNVPFQLIDPFKETVDLSILEKDAEGNIFFPQVLKFVHDLHKWVFVATHDLIVEWNDAGLLHDRLTNTKHHDDETPPTTQAMLPEWSKRKGMSAYMMLISPDESKATHQISDESAFSPQRRACTTMNTSPDAETTGVQTQDDDFMNDATAGCESDYTDLMVKHLALEHLHLQNIAQHQTHTAELESEIKLLKVTNCELSAQLDEQKRTHVDSKKTLVVEKMRLESDARTLRATIADMTKTLEQQDCELVQFDEKSRELIAVHARTRDELTMRIKALEHRIVELDANEHKLRLVHAAQMDEQEGRLNNEHAGRIIEMGEHLRLVECMATQLKTQHESEAAAAKQAIADSVVELQQAAVSLDDKTRNAHIVSTKMNEMQRQLDVQNETISHMNGENTRRSEFVTRETHLRVDDTDSKWQLLQMCRLQNDKERMLITQLSSLFLP